MINGTPSAVDIFGVTPAISPDVPRYFTVVETGHYRLSVVANKLQFDIDRLRRERHELIAELAVHCGTPGVGFDGVISVADFNLSSARARSERAKLLSERSTLRDIEWGGLLEELCQRVMKAERSGTPAVSLRDLPRPPQELEWSLDGMDLLPRHPTILFGDGGSAKSYLALWKLGKLAKCGVRVALFDWELAPEEHRDRLERIFGADMPDVRYVRCERALVHEVDALRRVIRDEQIEYAVFDSIAFACDGPPEAAEVAASYYRAVRQLGQFGSMHIAHITKAEGGDMKPFGSAFWHNGARSTWYVKLGDPLLGGGQVLNVFPRKCNLGPRKPDFAYTLRFERGRTIMEIPGAPAISASASTAERMVQFLRIVGGKAPIQDVADGIDTTIGNVDSELRRKPHLFDGYTESPGGRMVALARKSETLGYEERTDA